MMPILELLRHRLKKQIVVMVFIVFKLERMVELIIALRSFPNLKHLGVSRNAIFLKKAFYFYSTFINYQCH